MIERDMSLMAPGQRSGEALGLGPGEPGTARRFFAVLAVFAVLCMVVLSPRPGWRSRTIMRIAPRSSR